MKSYVIHLIRHGITQGNEEGLYIGRTDLPLSPEGRERLRKLRAGAPYPPAQVCFVSPLKRCVQTAEILYPGVRQIIIPDFRECDFGDWEGKSAREIAASDSRFEQWIAGTGNPVTPPNGESGGVFQHRVCAAFEKVVEGLLRSGITASALVAHGGTLMAILSAYGLPRARFYDWMTEDGCGYSMRITPGLWMRSMVGEVYAKIPAGHGGSGEMQIRLARKAAERAFGKKQSPDDKQ